MFNQLLWVIAPLGVMLMLRIFGGAGWGNFGLRPNFKGNGFWWLVSILVFPVVITISVLISTLLGSIELDVNRLSVFVTVLLPGLIAAMLKNIFEEFAWRGYLMTHETGCVTRGTSRVPSHGFSHSNPTGFKRLIRFPEALIPELFRQPASGCVPPVCCKYCARVS